MTNDEKAKILVEERDKLQAGLDEVRNLRMKLSLKTRDDHRAYLMKIGELSLIVGAAIIPVIIASNNNVCFKSFAILAVIIYLLSGMLALWRSKVIIAQDAEDNPFVGLDEETQVQPIIHSYNKLVHNPLSEDYIQEYKDASYQATQILNKTTSKKKRVDPTSDLTLYGFILGTLLVARTQWPLSDQLYYIVLAIFGLTALILFMKDLHKAQMAALVLEQKRERLAEIRANYQKWHDQEVLGKK